jgi:SAM-dependent methyltransferase
MNRQSENIFKRCIIICRGFYKLIKEFLDGNITLKQAYMVLEGRIINRAKLNDDFCWDSYHLFYQQELISATKVNTLLPEFGDFEFSNGVIVKTNPLVMDLHPNHQLLYEIILTVNPEKILELGCGGGDHLRNLSFFNSNLQLFGVDRSEGQLNTLNQRHPNLNAQLSAAARLRDSRLRSIRLSRFPERR